MWYTIWKLIEGKPHVYSRETSTLYEWYCNSRDLKKGLIWTFHQPLFSLQIELQKKVLYIYL